MSRRADLVRRSVCAALWISIGARASGQPVEPSPNADVMAQLWESPDDVESRDLLLGRGGATLVPDPGVDYRFESADRRGHSRGYEVEDPGGREWDVKVGDEAQSEVAASRILWAIGYHQPVMHFVPRWRMSGGATASPEPGRFRLKSDHENEGDWSWKDNPFVGTRPLRGLVIVNILLNNWDLATSQNRIYHMRKPGGGPARRYVVQDLGAALGRPRWPLGSRNDIEGFERGGFVTGVQGGRVVFDYHGRHKDLLKDVTPADVVWACRLLSRLSERQLTDAFRAGGYSDDLGSRFVRQIRRKIREGLALETAGVP